MISHQIPWNEYEDESDGDEDVQEEGDEDARKHAAEEEEEQTDGHADTHTDADTYADGHTTSASTAVAVEGDGGESFGFAHAVARAGEEVLVVHGTSVSLWSRERKDSKSAILSTEVRVE